jgi:hypothetical protein
MTTPRSRYSDRCSQIIRQWRLLVLLRRAPRTLSELARLLDCHQRTVRRDLYALQAVPLPIGSKYPAGEGVDPCPITGRHGDRENVWAIGVMEAWPRTDEVPTDELAFTESRVR